MTHPHPTRSAATSGALLIVVGMRREAAIAAAHGRTAVGAAGLAAALAAERPAGIISFGLCGGLGPALRVGDIVVADAVISGGRRAATTAAWNQAIRAALPHAQAGDLAAGDQILGSTAAKAALARATGAVAVDMESHAVAEQAQALGIPFAVLRVVSDAADRTLPRAAQAGFKADGEPDIAAVILALLRRPWELPDLIRVAGDSETAFRSLAAAATALRPPTEV